MTKLLFFTLFFGLFLHQSIATPWSDFFTSSFVAGQPKFTNFDIPVLGSPLTLNLVATNNSAVFVLCGQRYYQPTADYKTWSAKTCQIYAVTNATTLSTNDNSYRIISRRNSQIYTSELEIARDLIPATYWVGVVVQNQNANATLTLSGEECPKGHFGWNCSVSTTQMIDLSRNYTFDFDSAEDTKYLEFNIDSGISVASLSIFLRTAGSSAYDVHFSLFYGTIPLSVTNSSGLVVNNKTHTLSVPVASAGDYYAVLTPVPAKSYYRRRVHDQFTLSVEWATTLNTCPTGTKFGPLCQNATKVNATQLSQVYTYTTNANSFNYFYLFSSQRNDTFNVTVQSTSASGNAPSLYVRKGAVPIESVYDGVSANASVNSINVGLHDSGRWFFGVLGTGSTYAVWFNSQCPNGCSSNGNCVLSNGAYSCQCNDGYELFDCSQKKDSGFKTEYIVLIVIGSIIALAALVGLIVYLYNRGKHPGGGYERI